MRRILIATENSPCSLEAVRHFVETIGGSPAEIYVLSVIAPISGYHSVAQAEKALEAGLESADAALDAATLESASGGFKVRSMRRVGEPAETIVAVARELAVDLIVLGTHGPEALVRLAGGSVAEAVLHDAPCGVVIFPWHPKVLASGKV